MTSNENLIWIYFVEKSDFSDKLHPATKDAYGGDYFSRLSQIGNVD